MELLFVTLSFDCAEEGKLMTTESKIPGRPSQLFLLKNRSKPYAIAVERHQRAYVQSAPWQPQSLNFQWGSKSRLLRLSSTSMKAL